MSNVLYFIFYHYLAPKMKEEDIIVNFVADDSKFSEKVTNIIP